jgi:hypothetical protein
LASRARNQEGKSSRELVREKSANLRREKLSKMHKGGEDKHENLSVEDRLREIREGQSKAQQAAGLKATFMKRRKDGDSYTVAHRLRDSGDARQDIQDRMPDNRTAKAVDVNKHMARQYAKIVPLKK